MHGLFDQSAIDTLGNLYRAICYSTSCSNPDSTGCEDAWVDIQNKAGLLLTNVTNNATTFLSTYSCLERSCGSNLTIITNNIDAPAASTISSIMGDYQNSCDINNESRIGMVGIIAVAAVVGAAVYGYKKYCRGPQAAKAESDDLATPLLSDEAPKSVVVEPIVLSAGLDSTTPTWNPGAPGIELTKTVVNNDYEAPSEVVSVEMPPVVPVRRFSNTFLNNTDHEGRVAIELAKSSIA
ncbi:MAG: hypothetical protein Q7V63_10235 [Gammaproteobacteria bacterium]|nr:hypothetical protein [Gammaproteobacteria bacterium]